MLVPRSSARCAPPAATGCRRSSAIAHADALAIRLGLVDVFEQVSTFDVDGVERVARAHEADGLISPGTDGPVRVAAEVAERLGLAHPLSLAVAVASTDKRAQRAAFAAAGVPQPALIPADEPFSRPVVVKPSLAQGQRGLTRVERADELAPALAHAREQSRDGEALVEELVPGDEVTVNGFLHDGFHAIAVTDRERASAFGVATAHLFPARAGTAEAIVAARAACAALGIERGPVYVQIVLGPDGPRVMEVAARLGGGHDAELCLAATGIDLATLALHAALGERIAPSELWRSRQRGAIVRFLVACAGRARRGGGRRGGPAPFPACSTCRPTGSRANGSPRSRSAPTAWASCSPRASTVPRPRRPQRVRASSSASERCSPS